MSERELQNALVQLCRGLGWPHFYVRCVAQKQGAKLNAAFVGPAGFPDLVLLDPHRKRLMFVELKTETGRLRPEQVAWLELLSEVKETSCFLVRPDDVSEFLSAITACQDLCELDCNWQQLRARGEITDDAVERALVRLFAELRP